MDNSRLNETPLFTPSDITKLGDSTSSTQHKHNSRKRTRHHSLQPSQRPSKILSELMSVKVKTKSKLGHLDSPSKSRIPKISKKASKDTNSPLFTSLFDEESTPTSLVGDKENNPFSSQESSQIAAFNSIDDQSLKELDDLATLLLKKAAVLQEFSMQGIKQEAQSLLNDGLFKVAVFQRDLNQNSKQYRKIKLARVTQLLASIIEIGPSEDSMTGYWEELYKIFICSLVEHSESETLEYLGLVAKLRARVIFMKLSTCQGLEATKAFTELDTVSLKLNLSKERHMDLFNQAYKLKLEAKKSIDNSTEYADSSSLPLWNQLESISDSILIQALKAFIAKRVIAIGLVDAEDDSNECQVPFASPQVNIEESIQSQSADNIHSDDKGERIQVFEPQEIDIANDLVAAEAQENVEAASIESSEMNASASHFSEAHKLEVMSAEPRDSVKNSKFRQLIAQESSAFVNTFNADNNATCTPDGIQLGVDEEECALEDQDAIDEDEPSDVSTDNEEDLIIQELEIIDTDFSDPELLGKFMLDIEKEFDPGFYQQHRDEILDQKLSNTQELLEKVEDPLDSAKNDLQKVFPNKRETIESGSKTRKDILNPQSQLQQSSTIDKQTVGHHGLISTDVKESLLYLRQKPRVPWTSEELEALEKGIMFARSTKWAEIQALYGKGGVLGEQLAHRTQIQLKDKARNEKKRRIRMGIPLGVFEVIPY